MLAVLNHRSSAYQALNEARDKLFHLKKMRTGLFIEKRPNPFSCKAVMDLLAEIAREKLEELRLLLSLDFYEHQLRSEQYAKKQKRIWLGQQRREPVPETKPRFQKRHDGLKAYLLATLLANHTRKPSI